MTATINDASTQHPFRQVKLTVPAAVLGALGCRDPPQDQRLGFCLALWLRSIVRRITASCRAYKKKKKAGDGGIPLKSMKMDGE